jgi:hypothetical protein
MTTLNDGELATLSSMEQQAKAKQIGYWQIYQWLANTLVAKGVSTTDSALLWLRGADLPGFFGPAVSRKMAPDPRGAHEEEPIH